MRSGRPAVSNGLLEVLDRRPGGGGEPRDDQLKATPRIQLTDPVLQEGGQEPEGRRLVEELESKVLSTYTNIYHPETHVKGGNPEVPPPIDWR